MRCFWCNVTDMPAPKFGEPNPLYRPCDPCADEQEQGATIVEVLDGPGLTDSRPGLYLDVDSIVYPTGLWAVVTPGWLAERIKGQDGEELLVSQHGYVFVDAEMWDHLGLERPEIPEAR